MQHPDEGTIHAWIDGELTAEESASLEAHLNECAECSALVAEARGLVAASSRIVSALDIIPGNVIPKAAPRRRPWYASTQLRAAAAVVIVAGASMLVMRDRGTTQMSRVMDSAAPRAVQIVPPAAEPEAPRPVAPSVPAPVSTQSSGGTAGKNPAKKKTDVKQEMDARDEAANVAAAPQASERILNAPMALATKPIDSVARRRFNPTEQLDQVVVTGVATASAAPELLKTLRADSAGTMTVYEASPGVEVTLMDMGPRMATQLRASGAAQSKERQAAAPAAPPPLVSDRSKVGTVNSISWIDRRGHQMTLTGPLSIDALEALRKRLPADRR